MLGIIYAYPKIRLRRAIRILEGGGGSISTCANSSDHIELLELEALNTAATPAAGVVVAAGGRDLLVPPHRALLAQLFRRHRQSVYWLFLNCSNSRLS